MKIKFQLFKKDYWAFTLAEVLIVLAIIGVVAALTIPALMQSNQDNQYKVAYKKAFADLSNALNAANSDNVLVSRISSTDTTANYNNYKQLEAKFNVTKDCDNSNNTACWASGETFGSTPTSDAPAFIDNSGRSWSFRTYKTYSGTSTNSSCLLVDTNGLKPPNVFGKDRFNFYIMDKLGSAYNMPQKIGPSSDVITPNVYCLSGNCYNTSWLTGVN